MMNIECQNVILTVSLLSRGLVYTKAYFQEGGMTDRDRETLGEKNKNRRQNSPFVPLYALRRLLSPLELIRDVLIIVWGSSSM